MREVYLDNSATTVCSDAVVDKVTEILKFKYGNPSSLHSKGIEAQKELEDSRKAISRLLDCSESEFFFTSGGTESNNIAILGAAASMRHKGNRIVLTNIEHSSVLEPAAELSRQGFEIVYLNPDINGNISQEQIAGSIDKDTILVSAMLVNNETGIKLDVQKIAEAISDTGSPALLHCDAVQAFGKLELNPKKLGIDLLTLSGHKIHAPKGIGGIYIRKGVKITPSFYGGGQQENIRPGTENVAFAAGFAIAAEQAYKNMAANTKLYAKMKKRLQDSLSSLNNLRINSTENCLANIINISFIGIPSEVMVNILSEKGIYVSAGSACKKGKSSYVLKALGMPSEAVESAIRISFSQYNTEDDIDYLAQAVLESINRLPNFKR